jgi:predicted dithiol-disulfide oxidoreductase (DUF899 family)
MRKSATSLGAARLLLHVAHRPTAEAQCEGCTFYTSQVREVPYLHSRDVTYATSCQGPYDESVRYRVFMDWDEPWYSVQTPPRLCWPDAGSARCTWFATCGTATGCSRPTGTILRGVEAMDNSYALLDMTIYGRQETWEDSPPGWPQRWGLTGGENVRSNGRPTAQWSRLEAGRSDDLGTAER